MCREVARKGPCSSELERSESIQVGIGSRQALVTGTLPYLVGKAADLAANALHQNPARLEHSKAASRLAGRAGELLGLDAGTLAAAGMLHDLGYAHRLHRTGFHPLDGATYLMRAGWPDLVVRLVAHHSHAAMLADAHGVAAHYTLIDPPPLQYADVIAWADLTSGLDGAGVSAGDRVADMRLRHADRTHVPGELRELRYAELLASAQRVEQSLGSLLASAGNGERPSADAEDVKAHLERTLRSA